MTTVAQRERAALADLFDRVGPDQPTLDAGWLTRDLLVHLLLRERRADALISQSIPPLRRWYTAVRDSYERIPWPTLVQLFRGGPQWFSVVRVPAVDAGMNTAEFFIHHEDVRRGAPGWSVRDLDDETTAALEKQATGLFAKLTLRKYTVGIRVRFDTGNPTVVKTGEPAVTVVGKPSEVVLWISGRDACEVDLEGSPDALDQVRAARVS